MHARIPKNFVLEERLERYADAIELCPCSYAGCWANACASIGERGFSELRLDLGCGKGTFVVEAARREPHVLFVAVDSEPLCIAYAAQHVMEAGLRNVVVVPWNAMRVREIFGERELSRIYLNFPTPFPRKKFAGERLVAADRFMDYRHLLGEDGSVVLKTDSEPLYLFALGQLERAGYRTLWTSNDLRADRPGEPSSEYEDKLVAQGAKVHALEALAGEPPEHYESPAPESLMDYLPGDLTTMDTSYLPHGMAPAINNFRNRDLRRKRKCVRNP